MDTACMSATALATALRGRELSAVELLEATFVHSTRVASKLNPFAMMLYERAREAAVEADALLARGEGGPLCGVPITIKDSQWLADVPCANGSRALRDFVPDRSSAAIERLEAAGAVIFAKTTCPEFSLVGVTDAELYGRTSNPWHRDRTPGGSSGGAAVAVATGCGPLSLGGDGGGSIRIPAAFCGVVGFKPSFGRVPRDPCFPAWRSVVSYGPMARSVADARLMLSALASTAHAGDAQAGASMKPLEGLRLAVSEDLGFAPVDDGVRGAFRCALERLESAGATLVFDSPDLPSSVETWATTTAYDTWRNALEAAYDHQDLEEITRANLAFGSQFTEADFQAAQARRDEIGRAYTAMFERTGAIALLTPTVGCEAFPHGRIFPEHIGGIPIDLPWLDWGGFLYDANLTGMPACAVPVGLGGDQLPVSLQVMGRVGDDVPVLDVAERIEALFDWQHPHASRASYEGVARTVT